MSLLTIVQNACTRIGIPSPTAVVSSTDAQILQLLALANEEGESLATGTSAGTSYDWQALQLEASFVTTATESQGTIESIAPGFKYIIGGTIWDRTKRLPVYGSLDPQTWQNFKSWGVTSPFPKYRVRGGLLLLMPIPAAGDSYYFEYQTKNWCTSADGVTLKTGFTADDDVALLDEQIMTAGLIWRWKEAKGFEYAEDFRKYQNRVINAIARDTERPVLDMGRRTDSRTGIVIPIGSWNA
ncbi:MAG TPA: hypothetical protein VN081_06915 [Dongiaceae bacterium]|nr:hypothetical protein [Dongiaceae bacterium]